MKTIIVTGCNKGIGAGIVEDLCQKPYTIIMACRDLKLAEQTKQKLESKHPEAKNKLFPMQLDISNSQSIDNFIKDFCKHYGQTDILVNNAGMAFKGDAFDNNVVETTLRTNFFGTVELTQKMAPHVKDKGKIIIVGSSAGKYRIFKSEKLQKEFDDANLTLDGVHQLAHRFIDGVKQNNFEQQGFPRSAYAMSKVLINVWTRVFGQQEDIVKRQIQVNALCPGWVRTDMAGDKAALSIEQGAETPIFLIERPFEFNKETQGKFFYLKKVTSLWD